MLLFSDAVLGCTRLSRPGPARLQVQGARPVRRIVVEHYEIEQDADTTHTCMHAIQCRITPDEFVAAGDFLTYKFGTWTWEAGDKTKSRDFLPADKQYLVQRNGQRIAASRDASWAVRLTPHPLTSPLHPTRQTDAKVLRRGWRG